MKLINTRVITTALTVVTALVGATCAGGELKEHTFELQVQKQSVDTRGLRPSSKEGRHGDDSGHFGRAHLLPSAWL